MMEGPPPEQKQAPVLQNKVVKKACTTQFVEKKSLPFGSVSKKLKRVGDYELGKVLGSGHYGVVRLAQHVQTMENFAIKIVLAKNLENERDHQLLRRELRALSTLDHPNIVKLLEILENSDGDTFIVMEYCAGGNLAEYMLRSGSKRLAPAKALHYFRDVMAGLEYCHQRGIVHRDVKPENLLLTKNRENVKICDFGLSRSFSKDKMMSSVCGTLDWTAPEVLGDEKGDGIGGTTLGGVMKRRAAGTGDDKGYSGGQCDVWSLGCILYWMVTGQRPFDARNDYEVVRKIKRGKITVMGADEVIEKMPEMKELVEMLVQRDPKDRPALSDILRHPLVWHDRPLFAALLRPYAESIATFAERISREENQEENDKKEEEELSEDEVNWNQKSETKWKKQSDAEILQELLSKMMGEGGT